MFILCSIAVYCVSTLLFWHKDAGCVTKVYRNPNCSDGVGWSKANVVSPHGIVVDRSSRPLVTGPTLRLLIMGKF